MESLLKNRQPYILKLQQGQRFYLDDVEIYLAGVSDGVGSCSDLLGVNIAVFSKDPPTRKAVPRSVGYCSYAVLVRAPTEKEKNEQPYPECSHMAIEGLRLVKEEWNYAVFAHDGTKAIYVNTIS